MSTANSATVADPVRYLFARWRDDPGGTYIAMPFPALVKA